MRHYWTYIEVPNDYNNGVSFVVQLRKGSRFILNDCYFTIYKELFVKEPDSDYFYVELYDECNKKIAEEKIKRAVDLLIYITGIPYEIQYLREDNEISVNPIDISYSREKIERISSINLQYGRIRKKRELLENTLRLYAIAVKHAAVLDDAEEAYFANFRILEKIAKDEFGIEKHSINKGHDNVENMIKQIIQNNYGIKMPINKIEDLAGNLTLELFDTVFSDVYAKIAWFCAKKNIYYEEDTLAKAVKIRNALAHGDNPEVNFSSKEYKFVTKLSNKFIHEKFFSGIKRCYLEGRIIE